MTTRSILTSLTLLGSASMLPAATSFFEDFSGGVASTYMSTGTGLGSPTVVYSDNNFRISSGANSRIYLGTTDTDYSLTSFVFQCTVTVPNTTNAWAIAFIGMGSPNAGAAGVSGEPTTGSDLFMAVRNDTSPNRLEYRDNATSTSADGVTLGTAVTPIPTVANGTHGLRMTWDAVTKQALFEYDSDNNGVFETSFTRDGSDNGFTGTNSQLVLGGGNGLIFDNISIQAVPEPSAALLGGLGLLALLRRRR